MEMQLWIFGFVSLVFVLCIARLEREIKRVYRKIRLFNARLEAVEKVAGIGEEKTNTDIGAIKKYRK